MCTHILRRGQCFENQEISEQEPHVLFSVGIAEIKCPIKHQFTKQGFVNP